MADSEVVRSGIAVERRLVSLGTQAVENLRQAIIEGHYAPGIRLTERELCAALGVSRTLVREAIRQLEAEGWVENVPYRGPIVATTSAEEARQLYEIRAALEGWVAKRCAEQATDVELNDLSKLVDDMIKIERKNDLGKLLVALETFHSKLLLAANNPMLSSYLQSLRSRLLRLRRVSLTQPGRARKSVEEKRVLLTALKKRDGDQARTARETHILAACAAVLDALHRSSPPSAEIVNERKGLSVPRAK